MNTPFSTPGVLYQHRQTVQVACTRWYQGWGIHWTRDGTLCNGAGFDAVRVELASGRRLTIGDDASRLAAILRRAIDDRRAGR